MFQLAHQCQGKTVVRKTSFLRQTLLQRIFAGVSEGRMSDVVQQGQRLDQVLIQPQGSPDRAGDRRHFHRVGQSGATVVAQVAGEDLRLAAQTAKGRRVQNPVTIPLKRTPVRVVRLGVLAAGRVGTVEGVGCSSSSDSRCWGSLKSGGSRGHIGVHFAARLAAGSGLCYGSKFSVRHEGWAEQP